MNYNHFFYFWTVARNGSIHRASEELQLSQPTVSEQIRKLEQSLGVKLFERVGRGLRLSQQGKIAFGYAEEIFRAGRELRAALSEPAQDALSRLAVGVDQSVSASVVHALLQPALRAAPTRLQCVSGSSEQLIARLAFHQLDFILSHSPLSHPNVKLFAHSLARCGVTFLAPRRKSRRKPFPHSLQDAAFLWPGSESPVRAALDHWLERHAIQPRPAGEFSDGSMIELFAAHGMGMIAAPSLVERSLRTRHNLQLVGHTDEIAVEYFAITTERRIVHPALAAVAAHTGG